MLFLVDHALPVVLAHFHIWSQLNGVGRTSVLAKAAKYAAREIDAEPFREVPAVFVLRRLQRDAVHGAYHRAEITAYTAFDAVRITRENDPATISRGQI